MNTRYLIPLCAAFALLAACNQNKETPPPAPADTAPPPAETPPPPSTTATPGTDTATPPADATPPPADTAPANPPPPSGQQ